MYKLIGGVFLLGVLVFTFMTCTTHYTEKDEIYVRIDNQIEKGIMKLWMGSLFVKPNSYSSVSYQNIFEDIPNNTKSSYQQNVGKFWGYMSSGNASLVDSSRVYLRGGTFEKAVKESGISLVNTTMVHPFKKNEVTRPTLPDGKYTFILQRNPANPKSNDLVVRLVKD